MTKALSQARLQPLRSKPDSWYRRPLLVPSLQLRILRLRLLQDGDI
jgi:hypothetical protein